VVIQEIGHGGRVAALMPLSTGAVALSAFILKLIGFSFEGR